MQKTTSRLLLSPWTAVITLLFLVLIRVLDPTFVESVRLRYFDTLISSKDPTTNNIYTVNIDEDSLEKYGQWPLPRGDYARIIDDLYAKNAGLVVFNVLMPNLDRNGQDEKLAATLRQHPVILPSSPSDKTRNEPKVVGVSVLNAEYANMLVQYSGIIANISILENNAAGVGIVNTLPEVDGVNRRVPMVVSVNGTLYPSLSLETLRVAAGDPSFQIKLNQNGVEKMRIPKFGPINTDNLGRVWVDWSQKNKSVSLTALPDDFKGAIVIVGATAAGLSNPLPTSIGEVYPHDAQAALIGTMINGVTIQRPDWADGAEIIVTVFGAVLLLFLTRYVYVGLSSLIVLLMASVGGSYFAYKYLMWLFDITTFISTILIVSVHAYGIKFVKELLQKQQIKKQFGTYLSPALVEKLQKNPELLQLGGETRELTIMFTDVRGFTSISEHYGKDVQGLTKIMNRYMTAMTSTILAHEGTLDKYIGDAQMAFWNAPLDDPKHAINAVRTALTMLENLDAFNKEISREGIPPFGMGLGINTAEVVVGNMGSAQRFDYTCLGDGVNLASRFEGQSKPYGVKIIIGARTAELVHSDFFTLELDCIAVKGKTEGVNIYTVLKTDEHVIADYMSAREVHDLMLDYYREQKWPTALYMIDKLKGEFDGNMDAYYDIMIDRIKKLRESNLPNDWDGIFRATSK